MISNAPLNCDVTLLGAGIAGLMTAYKLASIGLRVSLLEAAPTIAAGTSTRNEGWLHAGTIHSVCIASDEDAERVSRRCVYGHKSLSGFAPESVEDHGSQSICVLNQFEAAFVEDRWSRFGVVFSPLTLTALKRAIPNCNTLNIRTAYRTADVAINSRLLYRKLLVACEHLGVRILTNCQPRFLSNRNLVVTDVSGNTIGVNSSLYIHTTGMWMDSLLQQWFDVKAPFRYWKAHLLIIPRVTDMNIFFVEKDEAGLMNHGEAAIVGFNEDEELVAAPDFTVSEAKSAWYADALNRMVDARAAYDACSQVACIKVDLEKGYRGMPSARSVDINVFEPLDGHICALPGKMTETPFMVDRLVQIVHDRIDDKRVALRPCDIKV